MKQLLIFKTSSALKIVADIRNNGFFVNIAKTIDSNNKNKPEKGDKKFDWKNAINICLNPSEASGLFHTLLMLGNRIISEKISTMKESNEQIYYSTFHNYQNGDIEKKTDLKVSLKYYGTSDKKKLFVSLAINKETKKAESKPDKISGALFLTEQECWHIYDVMMPQVQHMPEVNYNQRTREE